MVREIEADVRRTAAYIGTDELDPRVMQSMATTLRHEFVPEDIIDLAYYNQPQSIGYGQTISQPYIVALMTHLLAPEPDDVILEVGTGSGYQAAVLAPLVAEVHTLEIIAPLAEAADARLSRLGYGNVAVSHLDGYYGLEEHAPYDGIIVTAAAGHVPPPLVEQLAPGGRMVIPVGDTWQVQHLMLILKDQEGEVATRGILPVVFVPLTGGH
ncbi:MAG: protein-L-isoaspartate(D-aspartate) O-methyltransferase [Desulfovibrio sp.]|nr:MAG: protein-L-isoaspartate(D-aspartate) O-methyltransferase [Desulfovibrio sp.]